MGLFYDCTDMLVDPLAAIPPRTPFLQQVQRCMKELLCGSLELSKPSNEIWHDVLEDDSIAESQPLLQEAAPFTIYRVGLWGRGWSY